MKKRYFSLLCAVALAVTVLCIPALAVVDQSSDFYVADYSSVLSADTKSDIINYNGALEKQCNGAQIVVVTVDYLDGMTSSEYAMKLFNDWGVGSSQYNNGVLLLLATQENKYYVEYGTGLTGTSFENEVGGKMDKFENYFDAGEYDKAVSYIFGEMMDWFDSEYGSSVASSGGSQNNGSQSGNYYNDYSSHNSGGSIFAVGSVISLLVRLFIIYVFVAAIVRSVRRSHYARTGSWLPMFLFFGPSRPYRGFRPGPPHGHNGFDDWNDHNHHGGGFGGGSGFGGGGFGGGGFGGGGGGFGGGMGGGGGGFGGGGFGRN